MASKKIWPAAFLSYTHSDDEHEGGRITQLRERLSQEVRFQTAEEFLIFQERDDIKWGRNWQNRIHGALGAVTFLIPILTPSFFKSDYCRAEVEQFLHREKQLDRNDLILPIYYFETPLLSDPDQRSQDALAQSILKHQYADWRELRHESLNSALVRKGVERLASLIRDALQRQSEQPEAAAAASATGGPASVARRRGRARAEAREQAQRAEREAQQKLTQVEIERARENMRQVLQLPESPFRREGFELAHRLRPSATISGDFYQLIPRQDRSLGIYLVDVEGHGLVASQTAQDLRRLLMDGSLNWGLGEPREQLRIADRLVSQELGDRKISATMCFTEIDPVNKVIRFANAGMPYPLLFRRGESQPEVLRAAGFYVGDGYNRFPARPDRAEASVSDGDILVLFSDGIPEAANLRGRTFGQLGVIKAFELALSFDPEKVAETILHEVRRHSGEGGEGAPADDQSLLVVRIGEPPSEPPQVRPEIIKITETPDQLEASIWNAEGIGNELDVKLRPRILSWVGNDRPAFANSIWAAIWEAAANAVKHGSERGDLVTLRLTRASGAQVEALQVQPKGWPDGDVTLGERRRREVRALLGPSEDEPVADWLMKLETDVGTAIMLKEASQVRLTLNGRILTMSFDPAPQEGP